MGPHTLYHILEFWVYPFKDYIGDTGCYMFIYGRDIGNFIIQLHSFFLATFRYVCLFHDMFLLKFNLSPNVSNNLIFLELVSKNLNHFGVIAGSFQQIGVIVVDLCYFALFEDFSL